MKNGFFWSGVVGLQFCLISKILLEASLLAGAGAILFCAGQVFNVTPAQAQATFIDPNCKDRSLFCIKPDGTGLLLDRKVPIWDLNGRFGNQYDTYVTPSEKYLDTLGRVPLYPPPAPPANSGSLVKPFGDPAGQNDLMFENHDAGEVRKIIDTGYSFLFDNKEEEPGYGLYSYVIMTSAGSERSKAFLKAIAESTQNIVLMNLQKKFLNALYIPYKLRELLAIEATQIPLLPERLYNYSLSRNILDHLCESNIADRSEICAGDLSRGPYIFSYPYKISGKTTYEPPFLFVDLSDIHPKAFSTVLAAYKTQLKQDDITDVQKIISFKVRLLTIVLTASDWIHPISRAVADIVHYRESAKAASPLR